MNPEAQRVREMFIEAVKVPPEDQAMSPAAQKVGDVFVAASEPFRWLVLVLRATAVLFLLAFIGAALPESWMKAVYEWGEHGPWPGGALLVYLARAVCLLYGFLGLVALYLSFDVDRYRPLIRFMAIVSFPFAPVMFGVIWAAGLPTVWAVSEPAGILVMSFLWYTTSGPAKGDQPPYGLQSSDECRDGA
jgi:hypothetical protein